MIEFHSQTNSTIEKEKDKRIHYRKTFILYENLHLSITPSMWDLKCHVN